MITRLFSAYRSIRKFWFSAAILLIFTPRNGAAQSSLADITVRYDRPAAGPLICTLPLKNRPQGEEMSSLKLALLAGGERVSIPCQIAENSGELIWIIPSQYASKREWHLELEAGSQSVPPLEMRLGDFLDIGTGGRKALRYHFKPMEPPTGEDSLYTRSAFIHPVWSPAGRVLTQIHPKDHIHHMGFWMPWTKTEFEGRPVDFWNLIKGEGTVRFVRFLHLESGPVFCRFQALHTHLDLKAPGGEKTVLEEIWEVTVWHPDGDQAAYWIWDISSIQQCAGNTPLRLEKYRYGGFGFRGPPEWTENNSNYFTSAGKGRKNGNSTRARWCRLTGQTMEGPAGVALLSHPDNHAHPEPVRIWPEGKIFFGFCPVAHEAWELKPGDQYRRSYRIITFDGHMHRSKIDKYWRAFAAKPNNRTLDSKLRS